MIEKMKEKSADIDCLQRDILELSYKIEEVKSALKIKEDITISDIEEDVVLETGKKRFSNEDSRKRELRKRLSDDKEYNILFNKLKNMNEDVDKKQIEVEKLKREFKIEEIDCFSNNSIVNGLNDICEAILRLK